MNKQVLAQKDFLQSILKNVVTLNAFGDVSTKDEECIYRPEMTYKYFEVEPLRVEFEDEVFRSRFEAKLRCDPILQKSCIQPDLLSALYGEQSDWYFARCYWTPANVIFCIANKEILEQNYPTDEALRSRSAQGILGLGHRENGFVELCIPVYTLGIKADDAIEFTVKITAETGACQSLQAVVFDKESLIENKPRSDAEKPELYYLRYVAQRPIHYEQDWIEEEEG